MSRFSVLALCLVAAASASIPILKTVSVGERVNGDWRGLPVWQVNYTQSNGNTGLVHRQDAELWQLSELMTKLDRSVQPLPDTTQDHASAWFATLMANPKTAGSQPLHEFLSLNVTTGAGIENICWRFKYMVGGMMDFVTVFAAQLPAFSPEFTPVTEATFFQVPETPLECWVYTRSIQMGLKNIYDVYGWNLNYSNAMVTHGADFSRTNNNDVLYPGLAPITTFPDGYESYPVHNQARNEAGVGGYLNSGHLRLEYTSQNKFYFLKEDNLRTWIIDRHLGGDQGSARRFEPLKILDVGSGCGLSTFVYGELFPNANVTGIDLAPAYPRFQRARAASRGSKNTKFYWMNGQNMSAIPDNSYDIVSFTYVLHEMKTVNSYAVLKEIQRVLKPGGAVSGFEVSYLQNRNVRMAVEHFTTFGEQGDKDYQEVGLHGPEPFMAEFQALNLPLKFKEMFPTNVFTKLLSDFDTVYYGQKAA